MKSRSVLKELRKNNQSVSSSEVVKIGWIRHVLTVLSIIVFIFGCLLIGYMAWVLATSVTITQFLSGQLFFTYTVVGLGLFLFFTGLIGWVAATSESPCFVRMYLSLIVCCLIAEFGAVIAINILNMEMSELLQHGWKEVNQGTRNIIQRHFECCGFTGPTDFAFNNLLIDQTCYTPMPEEANTTLTNTTSEVSINSVKTQLKQVGCGPKLTTWLEDNKVTWVPVLACIGGLQLFSAAISFFILKKIAGDGKTSSRSSSRRYLHDDEYDM